MPKWFFAGALAAGLLLLGAAPAHADLVPVPDPLTLVAPLAEEVPGPGVDPANGLGLQSPLGGPLAHLKPGSNDPDLTAVASGVTRPARPAPVRPLRESARGPALFEGGEPLLGGLGGLLPANGTPAGAAASGLPPGGTSVPASASAPAAATAEKPADQPAGRQRSFSDGGRPVDGPQ